MAPFHEAQHLLHVSLLGTRTEKRVLRVLFFHLCHAFNLKNNKFGMRVTQLLSNEEAYNSSHAAPRKRDGIL